MIHFLVFCAPSLVTQMVKNLTAMQQIWIRSLGWEDPLKKGMATHSSILAWRIPRTEEPGGLQSLGSQRVRHDWVTLTHTHTHVFRGGPLCHRPVEHFWWEKAERWKMKWTQRWMLRRRVIQDLLAKPRLWWECPTAPKLSYTVALGVPHFLSTCHIPGTCIYFNF